MLESEQPIPHDIDSEKAVLGSLLLDTDAIHDIRPFLKPEDFFSPENQWVYQACLDIINRGEPINQITVAHQLNNTGHLEECGGAAYLSHLVSIVPTSLHIKYYGQIVKNTAIKRRMISAGQQITALGYDEPDPKIGISQSEEILLRLQKDVALPHLIIPEDLAKLGIEYYSELRINKIPKVNTGFKDLDWVTGGIFGGDYCLIAARPGMGKTSLMLTIAQHIGEKHGNALLVSLEERWRQILNKLMSEKTGYPLRLIRAGSYTDMQFDTIIMRLAEVANQKLYFVDSGSNICDEGTTTATIRSIATHMQSVYGLSAIFVDYLDLVGDRFGKNLYERTTYISREFKRMAVDLDVPLFCLCQLSRQLEYRPDEDEGKVPRLSDLRNSGALEQDADLVFFLYRDDYYQNIIKDKFCTKGLSDREWNRQMCNTCDNPCGIIGKADLILAKQRQGGERDIRIPLRWDTEHFRYEGVEERQGLE